MTLTAWMVYTLAVGVLFAGAAWSSERVLARTGWPTRWAWLSGLILAVVVPVGQVVVPDDPMGRTPARGQLTELVAEGSGGSFGEGTAAEEGGVAGWGPIAVLIRLGDGISGALSAVHDRMPSGTTTQRWALGLWVSTSIALAAVFAMSGAALMRRRRRWPERVVAGRRVRISSRTGPAVLGVLRPEIVLPEWATRLDARELELILEHEGEHLRGGDPRLLVAGVLLLIALPWNVALWWQLRRLRDAIEVDCDRRVLARGAKPVSYAELLVRIGGARSRFSLPAPALAGTLPLLERRLRAMRPCTRRSVFPVALIAGALTVGLAAVACETDVPELLDAPTPPTSATTAAPETGADPGPAPAPVIDDPDRSGVPAETPPVDERPDEASNRPVFTPFQVAPEIRNREEVQRALREEYPPLLRDAGVGGTVQVWLHIDELGVVETTQINQSSGHAQLDAAALRVASAFDFTPAINRDQHVPVWISIPIVFAAR